MGRSREEGHHLVTALWVELILSIYWWPLRSQEGETRLSHSPRGRSEPLGHTPITLFTLSQLLGDEIITNLPSNLQQQLFNVIFFKEEAPLLKLLAGCDETSSEEPRAAKLHLGIPKKPLWASAAPAQSVKFRSCTLVKSFTEGIWSHTALWSKFVEHWHQFSFLQKSQVSD